jgi:ABC-type glycerol-3-phosphate transport system permease component
LAVLGTEAGALQPTILPRRRKPLPMSQIGVHAALIVLLAMVFYPVVTFLIFSFKNPVQWDNDRWLPTFPLRQQNYSIAWVTVSHYMANTVLVAAVSTIGMVALSSLTAFVFARTRFPGKGPLYFAVIIMLMVPTTLNIVPQFVLYHNLHLTNTYGALIVPYICGGAPFGTFLLRAFFASIPEELFEAGRMDGCTVFGLYWRICLPLSIPILGTLSIISVTSIWNDYVWPSIAISSDNLQVISVGLVHMTQNLTNNVTGDTASAYGPEYAAYTIAALPLLVLFIFASRYYIEGLTSSGLKL